jgi:hypothetical protein
MLAFFEDLLPSKELLEALRGLVWESLIEKENEESGPPIIDESITVFLVSPDIISLISWSSSLEESSMAIGISRANLLLTSEV